MKKAKAWFGSPVQQVLDALYATRPWSTRNRREVEGFCQGGEELLKRLNELETCRSDQVACHMKKVIRATHRLNEATKFDHIFFGIELNPTTRTGFITRLAKLSRYQECCLYLCQTAKRFGLFTDAEVTVVSLDAQLFAKTLSVPPECCLEDCLSRCERSAPFSFGARNIIARLLESSKDNSTFLSAVRKALRESCIHAEVQLVCYYELYPVARKPRIICSSKDACYLCNLFIRLHGAFKVPKAHNNIYAGWRLLPLPALDRVLPQLNDLLEARIRELLVIIMRDRSLRLPLPQNPNESTVFPFSTSLPTPASSVRTVEASGSVAVKPEEVNENELGLLEGENALDPERSDDSSGQTPTTRTRDSASPDPKTPFGSLPVSPECRPCTPNLLSQGCLGASDSRLAKSGMCHEFTSETYGLGGESDGLAGAPSEQPSVGRNTTSPQQLVPDRPPRGTPRPEPGLTSSPELQSQQRARSDHEQTPELESARSPEPVLNLPPNPDPKPGFDSEAARPPPEAGVNIQQISSLSNPSFRPESGPCPEAASGPNPIQDPKARANPTLAPIPIPSSNPTPKPKPARHLLLERDKLLSIPLDTTATRTLTIPSITAGQITIHPELIRSLGERSRSVVEVRVHWLPQRRAAAFYAARPRGFVDLERFDEGVEIEGGSSECVYIAYDREVVVLDIVRG
jgi:hypothetical protein